MRKIFRDLRGWARRRSPRRRAQRGLFRDLRSASRARRWRRGMPALARGLLRLFMPQAAAPALGRHAP
ncbi:hypothetical protein GLE_3712 [Lysobacter enzymogenes]|uniref:Uncharacterized protein n=1 Tax=Lysobacter enzymogenes TaxID=69 RepID=A0A0S2DKJ2_LYSEN|nr:hypothetical protein GLE_3712 [Lysobacter enzymogenes]